MKIILCGSNGKMGKVVCQIVDDSEKNEIVAKVDVNTKFDEITNSADVIIDFSNPSSLSDLLDYAKKNTLPVVLATTGYTKEQDKEIIEAAKDRKSVV